MKNFKTLVFVSTLMLTQMASAECRIAVAGVAGSASKQLLNLVSEKSKAQLADAGYDASVYVVDTYLQAANLGSDYLLYVQEDRFGVQTQLRDFHAGVLAEKTHDRSFSESYTADKIAANLKEQASKLAKCPVVQKEEPKADDSSGANDSEDSGDSDFSNWPYKKK